MKIGIDCRLWKQTGVGTYTRNLVENLVAIDSKNEYVLFCRTEDQDDIRLKTKDPRVKIITADIPWHGALEQIKFPKLLNSQNLDLVHFPYFSVPIFYKKPYVITVHDLIVNKFSTGRASTLPLPLYAIKRLGYFTVLKNAIKKAKKIIVPTYAVRNEIMENYPTVDATKLEVTYEGGFDSKIKDQRSKIKDISGRYFLRVGNYYPHKNVEGLLKGFAHFLDQRQKTKDLPKLILVGKKDYFYERMEDLVEKLGIGFNVLFLDNIDDAELVWLYKNAAATIIPSFAEGFSLTAVEAMSLGSPILASDIPVHQEVCEGAAIYFDPLNPFSIAERMEFVLDLSDNSKKELISQGKKQSQKFSWEKMAKETLEIYNSI